MNGTFNRWLAPIGLMLAVVLAFAVTGSAQAGDMPEHWHLIHFIARLAGYNEADAKLVADASEAVDQNADTGPARHIPEALTTLALSPAKQPIYAGLFEPGASARMVTQQVVFHALSENRQAARTLWEQYIKQFSSDAQIAKDDGRLRIILTGMYLHYIVDEEVHPPNEILGHINDPGIDQTPNNVAAFETAAAKSLQVLLDFAPRNDRLESRGRVITQSEYLKMVIHGAVNAIKEAYVLTSIRVPGYATKYPSGTYPDADLDLVSNNLEFVWQSVVVPHLPDRQGSKELGSQLRGHQGDVSVLIKIDISMQTGTMRVTLPSSGLVGELTSFIEFVRQRYLSGRDKNAHRLVDWMISQLESAVQQTQLSVRRGTEGALHPIRAANVATHRTLDVIIGGSASSADRLRDRPWWPESSRSGWRAAGSSGAPSDQLESSHGEGGPPLSRLNFQFGEAAQQLVVEAQRARALTDGWEKYLKSTSDVPGPGEVRFRVDPAAPLPQAELKQAIDREIAQAPARVVIVQPRETADDGRQDRRAAEIVQLIAEQEAKHPDDNTTIFAVGTGVGALNTLESISPGRGAAQPSPIDTVVLVSPISPMPSVLAKAAVDIDRDTRFMDFGPMSRGHQQADFEAEGYARVTGSGAVLTASDDKASAVLSHKVLLEYFPPEGDRHLSLSNSGAGDIIAAVAHSADFVSGEQSIRNVMQVENNYKPSRVGGVSLVTPALLAVDGTITKASYNVSAGRMVLTAADGRQWLLPPMNAELVRIAYESVYVSGLAPEISIGSNPNGKEGEPSRPGFHNVYYIGGIAGNRLGQIMFRADQRLGDLAYGGSDSLERLGLAALGLHTLPEMFPDRYADPAPDREGGRVYLVPASVPLQEKLRGELEFGPIAFDVRLLPDGPAEEDFARSLISHWNEVSTAPAGRPFRELAEAVRIVAVFVWLHEHFVEVDSSVSGLAPPLRYFTPAAIPIQLPPTRKMLLPRLPLTVYSRNGVSRIIDKNGNTTRLFYAGERLARVERKDDVSLAVHADGAGNLQALEASNLGAGAAFVWDSKHQRSNFVDQVQLNFQQGQYVGFKATAMTQHLFGVDPDDVVATIVRNFIREGDRLDFTSRLLPSALACLGILGIVAFIVLGRRSHGFTGQ